MCLQSLNRVELEQAIRVDDYRADVVQQALEQIGLKDNGITEVRAARKQEPQHAQQQQLLTYKGCNNAPRLS